MTGPAIVGDASREAVDALKGYAYQIYVSALAWVTLKEDEVLHLEVAEDYAVTVKNALQAVQVKGTKNPITSNSTGVLQAIDGFVQLTQANPGHTVSLRYLTTSEITLEKRNEDRVEGEPFLNTWANLRHAGDLTAFRDRLRLMDVNDASRDFFANLGDEELRAKVLKRLFFVCGQPEMLETSSRLDEALIEVGFPMGVQPSRIGILRAPIIERILNLSCDAGTRQLKRVDLLKLLEVHAMASVPQTALNQMLSSIDLTGGNGAPEASFALARSGLEPLTGANGFISQAPRCVLVATASRSLSRGALWLHGGTGYGKTLLARSVIADKGGSAAMIRLRNMEGKQTEAVLIRVQRELLFSDCAIVLLDDLNGFEDAAAAAMVGSFVERARSQGRLVVVTSYLKPSPSTLRMMGFASHDCVPVEALEASDIEHMVAEAPDNHAAWAKYVQLGSGGGHPQLAHALVEGLRERDWPIRDLAGLTAILGGDAAVAATRDEVRRRLLSELPTEQRTLIYRLSMLAGMFEQSMVRAVASVAQPLKRPGELLDRLAGPWIDRVNEGVFELSPLLRGTGFAQLGDDEREAVHAKIAETLTTGNTIDASQLDQIIVSAIAGRFEFALWKVIVATMRSDVEQLPLLASNSFALSGFRKDRLIYPDNTHLSLQLRGIQVLLGLADGKEKAFRESLAAFEREAAMNDKSDSSTSTMIAIYGKLLMMPQLGQTIHDFPDVLLRLAVAAEKSGLDVSFEAEPLDVSDEAHGIGDDLDGPPLSMPHALMTLQITHLPSFAALEAALASVSAMSDEDRALVMPPNSAVRFNPEQIVKALWLRAKRSEDYSPEACQADCESHAASMLRLGFRDFAIAFFLTAAGIRTEELGDHDAGLDLLDAAQRLVGMDYVLTRGRAGILYLKGEYREQLDVIIPALAGQPQDSFIEQAYLFREMAVAHARLGDYAQSFMRFGEAADAASRADVPQLLIMKIGLRADEAVAKWCDGNRTAAVKLMNEALSDLAKVDPDDGFKQRALHRLVRFSGFWMYAEFNSLKETIQDIEADMVIGCCSNPDPHRDLDAELVGSITMIKYLLAGVDLALGGNAGIWSDEVANYTETEALLAQECTLAIEVFQRALQDGSSDQAIAFGPRAIDAMVIFQSGLLKDYDHSSPIKGRPPNASDEDWRDQKVAVNHQLIAFMLDLICSGRIDELKRFIELTKSADRPLLSEHEIDSYENGTVRQSDPTGSTFGAVGRFRAGRSTEGTAFVRPIVPDLYVCTMRLFEVLRTNTGNDDRTDCIGNWVIAGWKDAIREERFRLSTPDLAEGAVYPMLAQLRPTLPDMARLLLTLAPYVDVQPSAEHFDLWRDVCE